MKSKADDKSKDELDGELRELANSLIRKPNGRASVDEMSLESRRRAITYGRARGNA